jgi:hypothetical protein
MPKSVRDYAADLQVVTRILRGADADTRLDPAVKARLVGCLSEATLALAQCAAIIRAS